MKYEEIYNNSEAHAALLNLRRPSPKGKKFLYFGKFSAYFCGYAMFSGVQSALGVTSEIEAATGRKFFPKANFTVGDMAGFLSQNRKKYDLIVVNEPMQPPHMYKRCLPELMALLEPEGLLACRLVMCPCHE